MKQSKNILLITTLLFSTQVFATVYEDAEDESTNRWHVYDKSPAGATVDNVYLQDRDHNAIEFIGAGTKNGYILGNWEGQEGAWNNTEEYILKWSMKFDKGYTVYVRVMTKNGARYIYYTPSDKSNGKRNNEYIHIGLGKQSNNGIWQDFTRDLAADLKKNEPNNQLLSINAFLVRGNGMVDDVELINKKEIKKINKDIVNYYFTWKSKYLKNEDDGSYRIIDKDNRTVSEGQGYGMLITALLHSHDDNAQKIFNGLWKFVKKHPSNFSSNLMAWEYPATEGLDSAFDGDADIAYALILADSIWGSSGSINYKLEANKVLDAIWIHTIGKDSKLPLLGDWVNQNGKKYNQYTVRTSDFMPSHFKIFARFTEDDKWLDVVYATQQALKDVQNPTTGLIPDFIKRGNLGKYVPVEGTFLEDNTDGDYYYNACRVPLRLGLDVMMNNDVNSKFVIQKITHWFESITHSKPENINGGYKLNGNKIDDFNTNAFTAPIAVAAIATGDKEWASTLRKYVIEHKSEGYYEDTLTLLSLLAVDGNFINLTK